jgi:hypothetical protein
MHIAMGSQAALKPNRILTEILPAIRIIIPVQVIVKPAFLILPLVLEPERTINQWQVIFSFLFLPGNGGFTPKTVFGPPDAVALGVEQFFRCAEMVGNNRVEGDFSFSGDCLLRQRVEGARLEVPAADFRCFTGCPVFFRQGGALPEIGDAARSAGVAGLYALFFNPPAERVISIGPDLPVRCVGFDQPVEVVPSIIPGPGTKAVLVDPFLDQSAPRVVPVAAPADAFYFSVYVLVMAANCPA